MVVLVRHALLLSGVGLDVNDVAHPVVDEVRRQFHGAVLYISLGLVVPALSRQTHP